MQNVSHETAVLNMANSAANLVMTGKAADCTVKAYDTLLAGYNLCADKLHGYGTAASYNACILRLTHGAESVRHMVTDSSGRSIRNGLGALINKSLATTNSLLAKGISAGQLVEILQALRDAKPRGQFSKLQNGIAPTIAVIESLKLWSFGEQGAEGEKGEQGAEGEKGEKGEQGATIAPSEPDRVAVLACELINGMSIANFVLLATAVADRLANDPAAQAAIHADGAERAKVAEKAKAAKEAKELQDQRAAALKLEVEALQRLLLESNQADVAAQVAAVAAKQHGNKRTKAAKEARQHAAELHTAAVAAGNAYQKAILAVHGPRVIVLPKEDKQGNILAA